MTNEKFNNLFGEKPRNKNEKITQFHMDVFINSKCNRGSNVENGDIIEKNTI